MKKSKAYLAIVAATARDDEQQAMRLYTENRISYKRFLEAIAEGRKIKANKNPLH